MGAILALATPGFDLGLPRLVWLDTTSDTN
jgi:hypothetical protein